MATMNRIYSLNSTRPESTLVKRFESRALLVRSYKTKQMREIVVLAKIREY
ncbi:hypothetical protein SAMN05216356_12823 [Oribacterium sp. WCC10]|nr:hypothetical protein SAMN05216356_12823 [Oribacterium sp. WCC10]